MNKEQDFGKDKVNYCGNEDCEYFDPVAKWCIICNFEEWDDVCPMKHEIMKHPEKYQME